MRRSLTFIKTTWDPVINIIRWCFWIKMSLQIGDVRGQRGAILSVAVQPSATEPCWPVCTQTKGTVASATSIHLSCNLMLGVRIKLLHAQLSPSVITLAPKTGHHG